MSLDSIDDLEYAEGRLAAVGMPADYCRPTCGADLDGCTDEYCGCPCHEREQPEAEPVGCVECHGTGALRDQGYGHAYVPAGWVPVQRCDTCRRFETDEDAARQIAPEGYVLWCPGMDEHGANDDLPGDWAVKA